MTAQSIHRHLWEASRSHANDGPLLPDLNDLDDAPQLAAVSLVGAAARVAAAALLAHHGPGPRVGDEITHSAECIIPVLARVIIGRCDELVELVEAYRLALRITDVNDLHDLPF